MKFHKVGMRTIKSGIVVSLTILISNLLKLDSPFFAAIAAIIAMQASVSESLTMGKNRMFGTILGGVVALLFTYFVPSNILTIGIGIIIVIHICNILGWHKSIQLATMVFLSILMNYEEGSRLGYALDRTFATLVGLVVGTVFNYLFVPPTSKLQEYVEESTAKIYAEFKKALENLIWDKKYYPLENLRKLLNQLESEYVLLKKDTKLSVIKDNDYFKFEEAFECFETIYFHLNTIFTMDRIPSLDEGNKKNIEAFFNKESPREEDNKDNLAIIYNYHVKKIMAEFKLLEKMKVGA